MFEMRHVETLKIIILFIEIDHRNIHITKRNIQANEKDEPHGVLLSIC